MTDNSASIDDLVSELHSLRRQLLESEQLNSQLELQLLGSRQHVRQLQQLLCEQADRLDRHRATDERIAGLADFAEWACETQHSGSPASVLVTDLRRAVALEPFGGSAR
ncbi:MAG TPA: hypothetical protein VJ851_06305 [Jatrophihabitans sp.]|nr:hypothetical protein [Jatrophihabitans sp.]